MEMIPSIANYFGISIDELFGYDNERSKKINLLAEKIHAMNVQNNGVDINVDECIRLAREALIEFPGNETLIQSLRGAVEIFHIVCTDGNYGIHHAYIARIDTLLSLYLWLDGKKDEAFEALNQSLAHFHLFHEYCNEAQGGYTAPLVRLVQREIHLDEPRETSLLSLAEDWPWWCVPEYSIVKPEMQADPRWNEWVSKLK